MSKPVKIVAVLAGFLVVLLIFLFPRTKSTDISLNPVVNTNALDKTLNKIPSEENRAVTTEFPAEGQPDDISALEIEDSATILNTFDDALTKADQLVDFQMMNPESGGISPNETGQEFVKTVNTVDWQSARQHERLPLNLLTDEQSTFVAASKVPVLLPNNTELLSDAVVSVGGDWYAASMNSGEVNVLIDGNSITVEVPGSEPVQRTTFENYSDNIVKSLGMIEVSFSAYGVNYNVVVECYSHETDPACLENDFINSVVSNLLLAEGDSNEDGA